MNSQTASPQEMPPVPSPESDTAQVIQFTPAPDSPFGSPESQTPPLVPAEPSLVERGVDGAKRAAEATKVKLSDAEFRGKLVDAAATALEIGSTAVKASRAFDYDPQKGTPRVKPKVAKHAKENPYGTAARVSLQVGKAYVQKRGRYGERQAARHKREKTAA